MGTNFNLTQIEHLYNFPFLGVKKNKKIKNNFCSSDFGIIRPWHMRYLDLGAYHIEVNGIKNYIW